MTFPALSCHRHPHVAGRRAPQVIVLGFDGADPKLVSKWMAEGKLPNLARLARAGTFTPLGTTNPPESPVAWASFATGLNPGNTGIFDFLTRDPKTYLPKLALAEATKAKFLFGLIPLRGPRVTNERHGIPFYKVVADAGDKAVVLRMPLEFPPARLPGGELLAGLGAPDVRGTWGTFFYFSTELEPWQAGDTEFGGQLVSLLLRGGTATASVEGPVDPTSRAFKRIAIPVKFSVRPQADSVVIHFGEQTETVETGHWSGWFRVAFPVSPFVSVHAISRFYVISAAPGLRVYMSPLNIDPLSPALPISSPGDFAARLAHEHGLFKTLGWWHDTWGLNEEKLPDAVFLGDMFRTMQKLSDVTVDEIRSRHPRLLVSIFTSTDSVSHMFYRLIDPKSPRYNADEARKYGDAILDTYERMDHVVGRAGQAMEPGATLIVVSDHGFHSFRRGFNTNTWLVKNGYMKLLHAGPAQKAFTLSDLFSKQDFFQDVDWRHTQAYALGLGQIYLNLRGRERDGAVNPGPEASRLVDEIRQKLLAYRDPETGAPVLEDVYAGASLFHGAYMAKAPDLQLDFEPGYRTSWQTSLGAIPPGIVAPNTRKWSGDHCSSDPADTQGIFFSNRRLLSPRPNIMDIAPTVIHLFDLRPPHPLDGRVLIFTSVAVGAA
ncbi:MAG: alkaline phosphatase family protein, partial [Terriglobia bacterium]